MTTSRPLTPASRSKPLDTPPDGVEETALLGGRVRLLQPVHGYRAAIDPVLLAAAVPLHGPGRVARILDAGTGTGAAAFCLLARAEATARVIGLERDPKPAALAIRSADLNRCGDRFRAVVGDLLDPPPDPRDGPPFDAVMTNPPFQEAGTGTAPPDPGRAAAHVATVSLADWLAACLALLRPKGRLVVIHRADRLDALLTALAGRAGAVEVLPLWPGPDRDGRARPARRIIVRARKGVAGPATLAPGLVLHRSDGSPTEAAEAVLRDGRPLDDVMG